MNKEETKVYMKNYRAVHKEELQKDRELNKGNKRRVDKARHKKLRQEVLGHYGEKCVCCGEAALEFLAIDHIGGNGKTAGNRSGDKFYRWLKANNWPAGFRTLCHNCNQAIGYYGYCPHTGKKVLL
jgi:hypothetical protein